MAGATIATVVAVASAGMGERVARATTDAPKQLKYDLRLDLPILITGAALWFGSELFFKADLAPAHCKWCDRNADGTDALDAVDKGARSALKWEDTKVADTTSNVLGFAVLPLGLLGFDAAMANHDGAIHGFPTDALIIAESAVLAGEVNQAVKFIAGRERPFVHALPDDEKARTKKPSDNNLSFFSAHTNVGFALAVSAGTVATMRGYSWAPIVWAVGPAVAAFTGYLRIAADKHYFSDVMTGAVVGSAIGFLVPYVFHKADAASGPGTPNVAAAALTARLMSMSWLW